MHLACTLPAPRLNSSPNPSPPAQQRTAHSAAAYSLQRTARASGGGAQLLAETIELRAEIGEPALDVDLGEYSRSEYSHSKLW